MKMIKSYEYKLQTTNLKNNQALAEIQRLVEDVNLVRRERVIFDNVFYKLEEDIYKKEEQLKKYIGMALSLETVRHNYLDKLADN